MPRFIKTYSYDGKELFVNLEEVDEIRKIDNQEFNVVYKSGRVTTVKDYNNDLELQLRLKEVILR